MLLVTFVGSFLLYVRLFVVMGATWIMEGVSFVISPENNIHFFRIFDIWNALQGPIIFVSFIMKRRVWNFIVKWLVWRRIHFW